MTNVFTLKNHKLYYYHKNYTQPIYMCDQGLPMA